MIQQPSQFSYFISEKDLSSQNGILLVIALMGPISRSNAPIFEKFLDELSQKQAHWVIINLRDVEKDVERPMFPVFARLQKLIRDKPAELKLCGVHPELRVVLEQAGILRATEVVNNLAMALQTLSPRSNRG